jgi:hypothetical protein
LSSLELHYALPLSRLRIRSTLTVTIDSVLDKETEAPQSTVLLEVGPSKKTKVLKASTGRVFSTGVALGLTDESLLTSTDLEAGGEMGKIVIGVVGAVTTLAAAAHSPAGLAAGITALDSVRMVTRQEAADSGGRSKEEIELTAFFEKDSVAADLLTRSKALLKRIGAERLGLFEQMLEAESFEKTAALQSRLFHLERLSRLVQSQLDALNEVFKAWRATTIQTRTKEYERLISLDALLAAETKVENGEIHFADGASERVRFAWRKLGVAVTIEPSEVETVPEDPPHEDNQIVVRVPRRVTLNIYEKQNGKAVLKESKSHLVMDSRCVTRALKLRKSAWAKRSVSLGFSDIGALSSYKFQGESSAAAIASTAGSLPGTVTDSLEKGLKARELAGSLDRQGLEQQLAKVKAETDLKQQELTSAGLAATSTDYTKLERLKQRAELLQQRKTIRESRYSEPKEDPVATELGQLKQQVELLKLQAQIDRLS